jgi:general secretion pathway protein I
MNLHRLENLPLPLFTKEGDKSSLWQREVRRDFINNVVIMRPLKRRMKDEKGFTLLEVLIALAIVGGLLVTLMYTLNYHLGLVERQESVTVATLLAKSKMNDLEKNPENKKGEFDVPYNRYAYETFVKESPYPGISEIGVMVKAGKEEIRLNEFVFK